MEVRRITNEGDLPFADAYSGVQYVVEPGQSAIVPREAVDLWFGDNSTVDTSNRRARSQEIDRLHVRYGAYEDPELWEAAKPRVRVETLDGEFTHTVLSDPHGSHVTEHHGTVSEHEQLVDLIQQQAGELEKMRRELIAMKRADLAQPEGPPPVDAREPVPSRAARGRGKKDVAAAAIPTDAPGS
jgi:hypothetical protein